VFESEVWPNSLGISDSLFIASFLKISQIR